MTTQGMRAIWTLALEIEVFKQFEDAGAFDQSLQLRGRGASAALALVMARNCLFGDDETK